MFGFNFNSSLMNPSLSFGEISSGMNDFDTFLSKNMIDILWVDNEYGDERMLLVSVRLSILSIGNQRQRNRLLMPNSLPLIAYLVETISEQINILNRINSMTAGQSIGFLKTKTIASPIKNGIIAYTVRLIFGAKYRVVMRLWQIKWEGRTFRILKEIGMQIYKLNFYLSCSVNTFWLTYVIMS